VFLIITGPTGVGKSKIAVELALKINGEIISTDSMQIYKGMDIGTYKIKKEEMKGVKHYMLDIVSPDENFTVADFKKLAEKYMDEIKQKGKIPILAGGTGLYIDSIIKGLFVLEKKDTKLRDKLNKIYDEKGLDYLVALLKKKDREAAELIDLKNPRRVIRALEIVLTNKKKLKELRKLTEQTKYDDDYLIFVLTMERKQLYERINKRVDIMFNNGLIQEVSRLLENGVKRNSTSMQAIGYKQVIDFTTKNIFDNIEKIKDNIKKATRNYAKRQITWFKKYKEAIWLDITNKTKEEVISEILKYLNQRNKNEKNFNK
jgi:tRNA dimethylallyltransferase